MYTYNTGAEIHRIHDYMSVKCRYIFAEFVYMWYMQRMKIKRPKYGEKELGMS